MQKKNTLMVKVLSEDCTSYEAVIIKLDSPYVTYNSASPDAIRIASKLIVHSPDFLDRNGHFPLWCSHEGKYVPTRNVKL